MIAPVPALNELHTIQGRGGQDNLGSAHVVDGVVCVTEIAHHITLSQLSHLLVVVGRGQVPMEDLKLLVLSAAYNARVILAQAPHGLSHLGPPVGGHVVVQGNGGWKGWVLFDLTGFLNLAKEFFLKKIQMYVKNYQVTVNCNSKRYK